jgi:hypothetical protein
MKILMDWMGEGIMETPGNFLRKLKKKCTKKAFVQTLLEL